MPEEYIHVWGLLTKNPTAEFWIAWIDDTGDGGDPQTIYYGEDSVEDNEIEVDPEPFDPLDDTYLYRQRIENLDPDTEYDCEIEAEVTSVEHAFSTLSETPLEDNIKIATISDIHPWRGDYYMYDVDPDGQTMEDIGSEDPDVLLIPGDFPTTKHVKEDEDNAETILEYFETYHHRLNEHRIVPMFMCPGNHELGSNWDGTSHNPPADDDEGFYYELLFPNVLEYAEDEHDGEYGYCCEITIADSIQILVQDCIQLYPDENAEWTEDVIREDVDTVIPMNHFGLFTTRSHWNMESHTLENRSEFLPIYDEYPVHIALTGHDHNRGITYPFYYSEDEPTDAEDYEELEDGGYVAIDADSNEEGTIVEYSAGWPTMRSTTSDDWIFDELSSSDYEQHYIVEFSNPELTLKERDMDGNTQNDHTYTLEPE
ncbi:metallophosphoesterase family protein [Natronococcus pandeyae]|uniref:metallophosphoesterase family protein n=1 Tax=Natronococcus pandeyae TaxID=2055836 RepID=UPI001652E3AD|nr:metallophosphoesterase [Natronococcus pandeyae]